MLPQVDILLDDLDLLIKSKHLLTHPFYQAWSKGQLSKACLLEYALEYYQHVKAFPTYISALHSRTEDSQTRQILLKNLIEEEAGSPNHPDLWRTFALELGATQGEIDQHAPQAEISYLIDTFRSICSQRSTVEGLSALYTYESQIPEICISKIEGLKKHYGMCNPAGWEYFRVHIAADKEHAAEERQLLKRYVSPQNWQTVVDATNNVLNALWNFLSGLCHRHHIACA